MEKHELLNKLESILDEAKTGVLATTDSGGSTHMRWMTPVLLKHRRDAIFAFSVPKAAKIEQIEASERAEWMIQSRDLREIVNVHGRATVVDNPALKAELLDIIGRRLATFWHANVGHDEFVVIETAIEEAVYFQPIRGTKETVRFS